MFEDALLSLSCQKRTAYAIQIRVLVKFFLLIRLFSLFIWSIQSFPIRYETPDWKEISQFIALDIGVILINFIIAYSFKVYYLHDEGISLTEIDIA